MFENDTILTANDRDSLNTAKRKAQEQSVIDKLPELPGKYPKIHPGHWALKSGVEAGFARRAEAKLNKEITQRKAYAKADPAAGIAGKLRTIAEKICCSVQVGGEEIR